MAKNKEETEIKTDGWKDTFTSDAVFAGGTYSDGIYAIPLNIAAAISTAIYGTDGAIVRFVIPESADK